MDSLDVLGLDKPIKLGRVTRVSKITDDLLFDNIRGLPQVKNNYTKLSALLRKVDRVYEQKIKKSKSKSSAKQLRYACDTEKLQKVILFYQLWCHGLFPKANFQDCIQMLRNHTSFPVKEYRRGLISNEIHRLKVEKGIITEDHPSDVEDDGELYLAPNENGDFDSTVNAGSIAASISASNAETSNTQSTGNDNDDDEDDWGFLSINRRNNSSLFVDDEDDDEGETKEKDKDQTLLSTTTDNHKTASHTENYEDLSDNDFGDTFDLDEIAKSQRVAATKVINPEDFDEVPDLDDISDHDHELDIMREMGM